MALKSNSWPEHKDTWRTAPEVFQVLDAEFGFCLDAAANHDNALCRHYLTEEDDALNCDWHTRGAIFCNPPYSNITPWVKKAAEQCAVQQQTVVMLLPSDIDKKLNYGYTDFMSYSIDFRRRILSIKKHEGLSIRETAKRFHIGTTTIVRWTKQIDARPATSRQRKIDKSALERDVEQYPDAYQRERAERSGVCQMAICKALKKLQLTYKKNSASSKSRRRR